MRIPIQPVEFRTGQIRRSTQALIAKLASVGSSDSGYEGTLARIGLHAVQEQLSDLMPYLRGFQLLDLSDEGDYAAGFFVFEVDNSIVDAPVFLINGKLKGKEIAFFRDRQVFVPANSELIRYLTSMESPSLGEPASESERGGRKNALPNIDIFSRANRFLTKVSSYPKIATPWGREAGVFESYFSIYAADETLATMKHLAKTASLPNSDLEGILPLPGMAEKLAEWCFLSPKLAARVDKRLGKDWVRKVATARYEYLQKFKRPDSSKLKLMTRPKSQLKLASRAAKFVTEIGMSSRVPSYVDPQVRATAAKEIARYGAYFVDRRPVEQTKTAMAVDEIVISRELQGPQTSGRYRVPVQSGAMENVVVIMPSDCVRSCCAVSRNEAIVVDPESGRASAVPTADLVVSASLSVEPVERVGSWFSSLPEVDSASVQAGTKFLLVDPYGRVAGPFLSRGGNDGESTEISTSWLCRVGRPPKNQDGYELSQPQEDRLVDSHATEMRLSDRVKCFDLVEKAGGDVTLLVPKGSKIIRLKRVENEYGAEEIKPVPVLPLSQFDEDLTLKIAMFSLSVISDNLVSLNKKHMTTKQAAYELMSRYGLHKQEALKLVGGQKGFRKFAVVNRGVAIEPWQLYSDYGKKVAAPPPPFPGGIYPPNQPPYGFNVPEPYTGMSDSTIPVPEEYPQVTSDTMQLEYADQSSPEWSGYEAPYEKPLVSEPSSSSDKATAEDLANSPELLWENKTFLALIQNVRADRSIVGVVASALKLADSLGRVLFLMYAHPEEFDSLLGEKDASQVEEQMLSLFESAGDLAVDLMKRNIDVVGEGILQMVESA